MNHNEMIIMCLVAVAAIAFMLWFQSQNAGAVIITESLSPDEHLRFPGYVPSQFRLQMCDAREQCPAGYQCIANRYDPYYHLCMPQAELLPPRLYWPYSLRYQ